jgi:hypothetical protein
LSQVCSHFEPVLSQWFSVLMKFQSSALDLVKINGARHEGEISG